MKRLVLVGAIVLALLSAEVTFGQVDSVSVCPVVVDSPAEMVDGKAKFLRGLTDAIRFPKGCMDTKLFFEFTIEPDGTVSNVRMFKGPECADVEKAIEYIKQSRWTPAKHNGKLSCQRMILPIQIHLG